jgi:hypothetical protein
MKRTHHPGPIGTGLVMLAFVAAAILTGAPRGAAAASLAARIAQAEHNTNTVRTLVHHDTESISNTALKIDFTATGTEDETHNREMDNETVTVVGKLKNGKSKTIHYTADIIFLNGKTYYRISLEKNVWKSATGLTFQDPYTGGWKRGRTTVTLPKAFVFHQVGNGGSTMHVRAALTKNAIRTTVDLWISGGSTPYVVKEAQTDQSTKNPALHDSRTMTLGPFNHQVVIQNPTSGAST